MKKLTLERANQLVSEAERIATDKGIPMTFAVVDDGGHLVVLHRMDGVEWVSVDVAYGKAYTAAAFRTTSENVARRGEQLPQFVSAIIAMTSGKFVPQKGGLPIFVKGNCIGAIGASGGTGDEDVSVLMEALQIAADWD